MKTIEELYNEIISKENYWNYYNKENREISDLTTFKILLTKSEYCKNFIKGMMDISGKGLSDEMNDILNMLNEKENDPIIGRRLRHIVSNFFFGHVLYQNISIVRLSVDEYIKDLNAFKKKKDKQQLFSFMWFILCIFHDFGYVYENNLKTINHAELEDDIEQPIDFKPQIYTKTNIDNYSKYRLCKFGVYDHGIYGGKVFYRQMLSIGNQLKAKSDNMIFETENVEPIYQYAAWIIMCHNIFYNNGNDNYTDCYRCCGLDDFIKPKARCITLKNNPLLFLFCLADTLEPTKVLKSKSNNPSKDLKICSLLKLDFCKNSIKFDLSDLSDYIVGEKYKNNIKGINDWLADVSDDLTITLK